MYRFLELTKKYGYRKVFLVVIFLLVLLIAGIRDIVRGEHWKGCFETLCVAAFAANSAEHFAKKGEKDVDPKPPVG